MFLKNSKALVTGKPKISAMDFPRYFTSRVSRLYRLPSQISHVTYTSGKKFISILIIPSPWQDSQRPPFTLNENRPGLYPLIFDSGSFANKSRMCVKTPV